MSAPKQINGILINMTRIVGRLNYLMNGWRSHSKRRRKTNGNLVVNHVEDIAELAVAKKLRRGTGRQRTPRTRGWDGKIVRHLPDEYKVLTHTTVCNNIEY